MGRTVFVYGDYEHEVVFKTQWNYWDHYNSEKKVIGWCSVKRLFNLKTPAERQCDKSRIKKITKK